MVGYGDMMATLSHNPSIYIPKYNNTLRIKLICVNSTFSANYKYLSFKHGLTEAEWYINIDHLM